MGFPSISEVTAAIIADNANPMGDSSPEQVPAPAQAAPQETAPAEPTQTEEQRILDLQELVKDNKFKFGDKEWTLKDLEKGVMRGRDYTKKTQEIAEQRRLYEAAISEQKFYENLATDLRAVEKNPQLIQKFKSIYPEKFHSYLAEIEQSQVQSGGPLTREQIAQMIKSEINPLAESWTKRESEALASQFESWDSELTKKYTNADQDGVYALITQAQSQGIPASKQLWEQAYKQSHEKITKRLDELVAAKLQTKQTTLKAAKEPGAGGQTPGQAPPEKIGMKDAKAKLLDYLSQAAN